MPGLGNSQGWSFSDLGRNRPVYYRPGAYGSTGFPLDVVLLYSFHALQRFDCLGFSLLGYRSPQALSPPILLKLKKPVEVPVCQAWGVHQVSADESRSCPRKNF
jgi:hypothetical protein